ncbi:MAG: acyltransferase family protein [Fimbriimonas sp.]
MSSSTSNAVGSTERAPQIDSLTPLRGIAALLVVVFHINSLLGFMSLGPVLEGTAFVERGYLWVDFFFVLSGFIITHVYGQRFTEPFDRKVILDYVRARFARIYPLHFFALLLNVALYFFIFSRMPGPGGGSDDGGYNNYATLPYHFFMLLGFGLTPLGWNFPSWSISTEWWTYLLALPLFRFLNRGVSALTYIAIGVCVAGLYLLMHFSPGKILDITQDFGLVRCILDFVVGICAYQFYRFPSAGTKLKGDGTLLGATLAMVLLLHFGASTPPKIDPAAMTPPPAKSAPASDTKSKEKSPPPSFPMPTPSPIAIYLDAVSPVVFGALIVCAANNRGLGYKFLNLKPMIYLGDISYSVYLMQSIAFNGLFIVGAIYRKAHPTGRMEPLWMLSLIGGILGITILLASLTYRFVEIPARAWLRPKPAKP